MGGGAPPPEPSSMYSLWLLLRMMTRVNSTERILPLWMGSPSVKVLTFCLVVSWMQAHDQMGFPETPVPKSL